MIILDGKQIAADIRRELKEQLSLHNPQSTIHN